MAALVSSTTSDGTHRKSQVAQGGQRCFLEDVPGRTLQSITEIVKSTLDPSLVGSGKDAVKLKHLGIKIARVKRVENPELFQSYEEKRREIARRRGRCPAITDIPELLASFNSQERRSAVNEYYLFHGTDENAAINIAKRGFQIGEADSDNMFGKGIYFSDSFMEADQYTDDPDEPKPPGTELTVILARVVLGRTYKCDRADATKLKRLPCIQHGESCLCGPDQRRDSIESKELLFKEFAVYDGMQCYPEYMITYTRRENQPRSSSGDGKKKRRPRNKPTSHASLATLQKKVGSVPTTFDRNEQVNGIIRVHRFCSVCQKTRTALPVYVFHEHRYCRDNTWECVCTIYFPIKNTTESPAIQQSKFDFRSKMADRPSTDYGPRIVLILAMVFMIILSMLYMPTSPSY